ncbi:preprotein translocase subunit YajC [Bifidobacterium sp. W8108]|nr:preprotein translocase subunit YajC [Bifidobacterium sp. W8108]MBI0173276.1 preprotein translocase subunit YajC [Bifidobacterium sp. M0307]
MADCLFRPQYEESTGIMESMLFMIVIIALMILMMWVSGRKSKQQQTAIQDFRQSLKPGDEVATSTGLLGKIASVDQEKEQVVIDSEGSLSRWRIQAITKPPIVPAYVHDDEVDEEGNPLPEVENEQDDSPSDSSEQSFKADKVDDESKDSTDKTTSADSRE